MPTLWVLRLSEGPRLKALPEAFSGSGCRTSGEIELSRNKFESVPRAALAGATSLETISREWRERERERELFCFVGKKMSPAKLSFFLLSRSFSRVEFFFEEIKRAFHSFSLPVSLSLSLSLFLVP